MRFFSSAILNTLVKRQQGLTNMLSVEPRRINSADEELRSCSNDLLVGDLCIAFLHGQRAATGE